VHGVLKDAGFDGEFLHPCTDRRKIGSSEDGQWEELLAAIHDEIGSRPFMAAEVMELCTAHETVRDALPGELSAKYERDMPTGGRSFAISLGRWLQNRDGRYVGDYVVRAKGRASSKNTKLWEITREGDDA